MHTSQSAASVMLDPIRASNVCWQLNLLLPRYDAPLAKRFAKCILLKGALRAEAFGCGNVTLHPVRGRLSRRSIRASNV